MPEPDTLASAARSILTRCRECRDEMPVFSTNVPPADFIIWGKLAEPKALGPKCYDHAVKYLGHDMPHMSDQYAVVDLRPLRAALAAHDQQGEPDPRKPWPQAMIEADYFKARKAATEPLVAYDDFKVQFIGPATPEGEEPHNPCVDSGPDYNPTPEGGDDPLVDADALVDLLSDMGSTTWEARAGVEMAERLAAALRSQRVELDTARGREGEAMYDHQQALTKIKRLERELAEARQAEPHGEVLYRTRTVYSHDGDKDSVSALPWINGGLPVPMGTDVLVVRATADQETTDPPEYLRPDVRKAIAEELRSEAEIAARPGQFDRLNALAERIWPDER